VVAKKGLDVLATWHDANEEGGLFLSGHSICYADVVFASRLKWAKVALGGDSKDWKVLTELNGGRWGKIAKNFAQFESVV